MQLIELKKKTPADLVAMAEELGVEQASTLRKQDLLFGILKAKADSGEEIIGSGTIEVLADGFGFLRSADANYLAGPDDIYLTPGMVRRFGIRTGDTLAVGDRTYTVRNVAEWGPPTGSVTAITHLVLEDLLGE